jgi:hypothetical protein
MGMVLPKSPKPKILEQDIRGAKYFKLLGSLLNELHEVGTERDKAGHRQLYFDHYGGGTGHSALHIDRSYATMENRRSKGIESYMGGKNLCLSHFGHTS